MNTLKKVQNCGMFHHINKSNLTLNIGDIFLNVMPPVSNRTFHCRSWKWNKQCVQCSIIQPNLSVWYLSNVIYVNRIYQTWESSRLYSKHTTFKQKVSGRWPPKHTARNHTTWNIGKVLLLTNWLTDWLIDWLVKSFIHWAVQTF